MAFDCTPDVALMIPHEQFEEITLMSNIKKFTSYPFNECKSLYQLTVLSNEPPTVTKSQFLESQFYDVDIIVPIKSLEKYKSAKVWSEFKYIKAVDNDEIDDESLEAPVISIVNGRLRITSSIDGSKCAYSINSSDFKEGEVNSGDLITLSGQYTIEAYTTLNGSKKSKTVSALLVWVNPTIKDTSNVISMEARKAVVLKSEGDDIVICGTEQGERITLYSMDGIKLYDTNASDGETRITCGLQKGMVYIIKYGDKTIKYCF